MTDTERLPDPLPAIGRLPRGAAVVYRHYGHPEREKIGRAARARAKARGVLFLVANDAKLALRLRADGIHAPRGAAARLTQLTRLYSRLLITAAVHSPVEAMLARRANVSAVLVAPVFATRSHPSARPLGVRGLARLARIARRPAIALGGIDAKTARAAGARAAGLAAIGAWI